MQPSSINSKSQKLRAFLAGILIFVATVNIALYIAHDVLQKYVRDYLSSTIARDVTVKNFFYLFPGYLILQDVCLIPQNAGQEGQRLKVPALVLKISIPKVLTKGGAGLYEVIAYRPKVSNDDLFSVMRNNINEIISFFQQLPEGDIRFSIKDLAIVSKISDDEELQVHVDYYFATQGDLVSGGGSVQKVIVKRQDDPSKDIRSQGDPVGYKFDGFLQGKGFRLNKLVFQDGNVLVELNGWSDGEALQLKGFAFADLVPRRSVDSKSSANGLYEKGLHVLDIDLLLKFDFPKIKIENFNFTVNNVPFYFKGDVFLGREVEFDLRYVFFPPKSAVQQIKNFSRGEGNLTGVVLEDILVHKGKVSAFFDGQGSVQAPLDVVEVLMENMTVSATGLTRLIVRLDKATLYYGKYGNLHRLDFEELGSSISLITDRLVFVESRLPFFGGKMYSKAWFDLGYIPPRITSSIKLVDVKAGNLDVILEHFRKISGRLYSDLSFTNYPLLNLTGNIDIKKGNLKDFEFFKWLGETFNLPSLKDIDFDRAVSGFTVDSEIAGLYEIDLDSKDVKVKGYFSMDGRNFVSSDLSLLLSRKLLLTSGKIRSLIKEYDPRVRFLGFDFKLSGPIDRMNFQWLDSELKQKIQRRIPDFIERKIERDIDKILEPEDIEK